MDTVHFELSELYVGNSDGKKEAVYRKDFEELFFNHNNIYDSCLKKEKYLVLGRKGTGKTILAEYIQKMAGKDPLWFSTLVPFSDFKYQSLKHLQADDVRPNEYIPIWTWLILLELCYLLVDDRSIKNPAVKAIESFLKNNSFELGLNAQKLLEVTEKKSIKAATPYIGGDIEKEKKYGSGSYLNYLDNLRSAVISALKSSQCTYTILLDELDERFQDKPNYRDSIISLLKAVDRINLDFVRLEINVKVLIFLRNDIFDVLNDPDLNKILSDNSVQLDWGRKVSKECPIFKMVLEKIRRTAKKLSKYSDEELFMLLFPQTVNDISPEKFILERTFFRPRDVVQYLSYIIEKYPNTQYFGWKGFTETEGTYSEYLLREVKNDLSGHIEDEIILHTINLLKQYGLSRFNFKNFLKFLQDNIKSYPGLKSNLENSLRHFYRVGAIGNIWSENVGRESDERSIQSWSFREDHGNLDLNKELVIHRGLKKALSLR